MPSLPRKTFGGSIFLVVIALTLWGWSVVEARRSAMGPYGLITQLRWPFFAALSLIGIAAGVELMRTRIREWRLCVIVISLVLVLFATSPATTQVAALTDSYIHTGFIDYILHHGGILRGFDARFSWPGSFTFGALLTVASGLNSTLALLKWFPPVIELIYLAPLIAIGRAAGVPRRTAYLGLLFFYTGNWIYQDYFSPQAMNFLFFLTTIAIILTTWRPTVHVVSTRFGRALSTLHVRRFFGYDAQTNFSGGRTALMCVFIAIIVSASAVAHQLTPYALILAMGSLVLARRLGRPEVLVFTALVTVGWLSLGAYDYWIGHLSNIFGSFGSLGSTVGSNVTSRVVGATSHLTVVKWRIYVTALTFALAGVGVLRRATDDRSLELLAGVPFVLLFAQSYGGEGLLRAVLFSLPFTSLLAASAFLPRRYGSIRPWIRFFRGGRWTRLLIGATIAVVVTLSGVALTFVRGGNDYFETYTAADFAAAQYINTHAQTGQIVGIFNSYVPLGSALPTLFSVFTADTGPNVSLTLMNALIIANRPDYILFTDSQEHWGEVGFGFAKGWMAKSETVLLHDNYRVAFRSGTAFVLAANA